MERKIFIRNLIFSIAAPSLLISACTGDQAADQANLVQTYTCPMHPQVVQDKPGTCPICGMDLVPFDKTNKEKSLILSENQQLLANVTTIAIGKSSFDNNAYLNGRLVVNQDKTNFISSRLPGRIEVLYVKETGVQVKSGQPIYKL